ncbi:MAG: carboxypeptidase-like regulatory domain-containing protein [Acidobacteria bacterium]|nr:carboxypeptidase-like regulatory domain-containing protein [Acidobacteriota bacterium]
MKQRMKSLCLRVILLSVVGLSVYGQSATATLSGTVTDQSGAVIAGVTVTVTDTARSGTRKTVTSSDGYFTLTQLPPGRYMVRFEREGFTPTELNNVVLNVGDQSALKVQLRVAQIGETVTILKDTPLVGESPSVATVVDRQFVEN